MPGISTIQIFEYFTYFLCCLLRSRWNIVMTITMLGLLCSSVFLFMYFAYRDSQMTGRLNKLEDTIERLTSGSNDDQPSGEYGCLM